MNETLDIEEAALLLKAEIDTVMQLARTGELQGARRIKSAKFSSCGAKLVLSMDWPL